MVKKCIACGMPMEKAEDFSQGDMAKDYCVHCSRPDGSMHSFAEKVEGLTNLIVKTQGLDEIAAKKTAVDLMSKLPAWKDHLEGETEAS